MIIEWLVTMGAGIGEFFFGLFPTWDIPAFLISFDATINDLLGNLDGVAVWADWVYVISVVTAVVVVWLLTFAGKIVRAIAAHVPLFGGAG